MAKKLWVHSKERDESEKALPVGKRVSKSGRVYYEYRLNHADVNPKRKLREGDEMPKDSTEYLIDQELQPLIDKVRERAIEPDYRNKFSDYDILGMIISKYSRWDLNNLKEIFISALEDSNFSGVIPEVEQWKKGGQMHYDKGGDVENYEVIRTWAGDFSDAQIKSVYEGYEESGEDLDKNAKIKGVYGPERFGEITWKRVNELFSEIQPNNWADGLTEKDVKDILWGVVMANKTSTKFNKSCGGFYREGGILPNFNATVSFWDLFTK